MGCMVACALLSLQHDMEAENPEITWAPACASTFDRQERHSREQVGSAFPKKRIENSPQCMVCLQDVLSTQQARELQCNHFFHAECIMEWWFHTPRSELACPVCRQIQDLHVKDVEACTARKISRGRGARRGRAELGGLGRLNMRGWIPFSGF